MEFINTLVEFFDFLGISFFEDLNIFEEKCKKKNFCFLFGKYVFRNFYIYNFNLILYEVFNVVWERERERLYRYFYFFYGFYDLVDVEEVGFFVFLVCLFCY